MQGLEAAVEAQHEKWFAKRPPKTCVREKKCVHELIMWRWSKFIEKRNLLCYGKKLIRDEKILIIMF